MSGSGLWFSRFTAGSEGWLPLFALGDAAWQCMAGGLAAECAGNAPGAAAQSGTGRAVNPMTSPQPARLERE